MTCVGPLNPPMSGISHPEHVFLSGHGHSQNLHFKTLVDSSFREDNSPVHSNCWVVMFVGLEGTRMKWRHSKVCVGYMPICIQTSKSRKQGNPVRDLADKGQWAEC